MSTGELHVYRIGLLTVLNVLAFLKVFLVLGMTSTLV